MEPLRPSGVAPALSHTTEPLLKGIYVDRDPEALEAAKSCFVPHLLYPAQNKGQFWDVFKRYGFSCDFFLFDVDLSNNADARDMMGLLREAYVKCEARARTTPSYTLPVFALLSCASISAQYNLLEKSGLKSKKILFGKEEGIESLIKDLLIEKHLRDALLKHPAPTPHGHC